MNKRLLVCIWALATGLAALPDLHAAPISGKFVIGGEELPLKEVAAFRMRDQRNPRQFETYVMLTATPVDRKAIAAALDPYMVAINDPAVSGEANFLGLSVSAEAVVGMNARFDGTQYLDTSGTMMGQKGSLVATCKENSATRISCVVKTAQPVKSMDGPTWSMDMTFESEVLSRPQGKAIAKDGEAPGKALLALRAALGGKDLAKILALLAPEEAKSYQEDWRSPQENLESARDILGTVLPKKPKITGGEWLATDSAVLEVEGEPFDGTRMLYLVEMRQVNGNWVFVTSRTAGLLR
ncbi:MAG: hypothetical protein ABI689_03050 [Thermoanaerobaculia bacterium]